MKTATSKIVLKSQREIALMRAAGAVVYRVLTEIESSALMAADLVPES